MIDVLIADDHQLLREGLKRILDSCPDISVTAEAENGEEVLERALEASVDVVVLDVSMPGPGFLEIMRLLQERKESIRILVLSMYPESQYAIRAMRAGGDGYLTKDHSPEELADAIRRIYAGGKYVTSSLAERLAEELALDQAQLGHEALSDREYEVLRRLGSGRSVKEIAADLSLSPKTVSTYRSRVLHKMRLESNAELIRYSIEHHLVD